MSENNKYDHKKIEDGLYGFWKDQHFFEPCEKSEKGNFSIILPPPNVTGRLHLGHAWDGSIQDCIIRYKKLQGYRTAWVPGTDHAGIATQTKFERELRNSGIDPRSMTNDEFLGKLRLWAIDQAEHIRSQWAKLGFALSYSGETFTLDDNVSELVNKVFIGLYEKKIIYQDYKLVNWDVQLKTAVSDIEVIKRHTKSKMYYFKYEIEGSNKFLTVATTRPETMFGDTNIFVNPKDERYIQYIGKRAINPANNQPLTIIGDEYVDMEFGTGVMKCTPAHDFNDYNLAKKHNITNFISIMREDGKMNEHAKSVLKDYSGIERGKAREILVQELTDRKMVVKIEDHFNEIGYSERTNVIIEPLLSKQWFMSMGSIVAPIIQQQRTGKNACEMLPKRFNKTLLQWLDNIQDWCISRQLLWGHRLPVWYDANGNTKVAIDSPGAEWKQEEGVLDTWFSSGLWPIALTLQNKENKFHDMYPVDVLVTAYDIIFFWVARMLFQCQNFSEKNPLKTVLFHGLIRDEQNRKMSKSLNNGIDPMDVIDEYGADSLRLFLLSSSTMGEDLRFSTEKIKYCASFINKLWNAKNFVQQYKDDTNNEFGSHIINMWILAELNKSIAKSQTHFDKYNFVIVSKTLLNFTWEIFCNKYLEYAKPLLNNPTYRQQTINTIKFVYRNILIALHPFIPFVTERIFMELFGSSIMTEKWYEQPANKSHSFNTKFFKMFTDIIDGVRDLRIKYNIKRNNIIVLNIISSQRIKKTELNDLLEMFQIKVEAISPNRTNADWELINFASTLAEFSNTYVSNNVLLEKLLKEFKQVEFELERSKQILANQNFIAKAPQEKVRAEQQKLIDYQIKFDELKSKLK